MRKLTYKESNKYYAIVTLKNGLTYYVGGFKSRSSARRYAMRENAKQRRS